LPAPEVDPYREVVTKGTLRDAPNRFVIGKRQQGLARPHHQPAQPGLDQRLVPKAKRWGWVKDIHL